MRDFRFKLAAWLTVMVGSLGVIPGYLPFRTGKILLVEFCLFVSAALLFIKNNWVKAFLIYATLRTAFGINKQAELTLHMLFFVIIMYQILSNIMTKDRIEFILDIICLTVTVECVLVIMQYAGIWFMIYPKGVDISSVPTLFKNTLFSFYYIPSYPIDSITGILDNSNIAGAFISMGLPAFFRRKFVWLMPILFFSLYILGCFGSVIAAACVMSLWAIWKFRHKAIIVISLALICLSFYAYKQENIFKLSTLSHRKDAWIFYVSGIVPKRPVEGWGLGSSNYMAPLVSPVAREQIEKSKDKPIAQVFEYMNKEKINAGQAFYHPHNEVILAAVELGIIGLMLSFLYFSLLVKRTWRKNIIVSLGIISCLLNSMYIFNFHSAIGLLLIVYMAMGDSECLA